MIQDLFPLQADVSRGGEQKEAERIYHFVMATRSQFIIQEHKLTNACYMSAIMDCQSTLFKACCAWLCGVQCAMLMSSGSVIQTSHAVASLYNRCIVGSEP